VLGGRAAVGGLAVGYEDAKGLERGRAWRREWQRRLHGNWSRLGLPAPCMAAEVAEQPSAPKRRNYLVVSDRVPYCERNAERTMLEAPELWK
jgi:hypothetical protein